MNRILAILTLFALPVCGQNANDFLFQKKKSTAGFENVFLPSGTNLFPYFSSAGTITTLASGATGRSLLGAADASAAKTTLGIQQLFSASSGFVFQGSIGGNEASFGGDFPPKNGKGSIVWGWDDGDNLAEYTVKTPNITGNVTNTLPSQSGTLLNTASSIALSQLDQSGATSGQALTWNGTAWAPAGTITTTATTIILDLTALPDTDPNVAGQIWRDGTTLKISTGP